jgi:hypothetical protein
MISIDSIVTIAITSVFTAVSTSFLSWFFQGKLRDRDAGNRFREAINSTIVGLPERPAGHFTLDDVAGVKATVIPIDLACRNFSLFLNKRKGIALEQTMQAYRKACQEDIPQRQRDWTEYIIQCAMQNTKPITPAQILKTHVDTLLSFVDKT